MALITNPKFDPLWKPPPVLTEDKDAYRWFYKICEILNTPAAVASLIAEILQYPPCQNITANTITKGMLVSYASVTGGTLDIVPYLADGSMPSFSVLGIAAEDILAGELGKVWSFGVVSGIDTSAYPPGTIIYASPTVAGGVTDVKPAPPSFVIVVGTVLTQATVGEIFIRIVPQLRPAYGTFVSEATQSCGSTTTAYIVQFPITRISRGVTVHPTLHEITVETSGLYTFAFSLCAKFTGTPAVNTTMRVWARVNGVDVQSTARAIITSGNVTETVAAWSYTFSLAANSRFQLMWTVTNVGLQLLFTPAAAPAPSSASAAITVTQVSV